MFNTIELHCLTICKCNFSTPITTLSQSINNSQQTFQPGDNFNLESSSVGSDENNIVVVERRENLSKNER
jgi:transcription elongation factor